MASIVTCTPTAPTFVSLRSASLADRLEQGARELAAFARQLSPVEWRTVTSADRRPVGVIVHHVASVYPLEVRLAQMIAAGTPIVGVTWPTVHAMNAAHAAEHAAVTRDEALALLTANSAAASEAIRQMSDADLDAAAPVSLYGDAVLTAQFVLEDHAVRHSLHHLSRLRGALSTSTQA